jgi:hypothetical protein
LKYEWQKWVAGFSYLNAKGYYNAFTGASAPTSDESAYVKHQSVYGVGGAYTWFPGMATQLDYVHVKQERADVTSKNTANVFVLSQKLTF